MQGPALINTLQMPVPTEAAPIKTMVLVRDDAPTSVTFSNPAAAAAAAPTATVVVLLLASHKVDVRTVAQHMQLPKGALRLATPEEAVASTGYEMGCIPPLGRHLLRWMLLPVGYGGRPWCKSPQDARAAHTPQSAGTASVSAGALT
jgi:hypothetical protein